MATCWPASWLCLFEGVNVNPGCRQWLWGRCSSGSGSQQGFLVGPTVTVATVTRRSLRGQFRDRPDRMCVQACVGGLCMCAYTCLFFSRSPLCSGHFRSQGSEEETPGAPGHAQRRRVGPEGTWGGSTPVDAAAPMLPRPLLLMSHVPQ